MKSTDIHKKEADLELYAKATVSREKYWLTAVINKVFLILLTLEAPVHTENAVINLAIAKKIVQTQGGTSL